MIQSPFIEDPRPVGVWLSASILDETIRQFYNKSKRLTSWGPLKIYKNHDRWYVGKLEGDRVPKRYFTGTYDECVIEYERMKAKESEGVCGCTRDEMRRGCAKCCGGK